MPSSPVCYVYATTLRYARVRVYSNVIDTQLPTLDNTGQQSTAQTSDRRHQRHDDQDNVQEIEDSSTAAAAAAGTTTAS